MGAPQLSRQELPPHGQPSPSAIWLLEPASRLSSYCSYLWRFLRPPPGGQLREDRDQVPCLLRTCWASVESFWIKKGSGAGAEAVSGASGHRPTPSVESGTAQHEARCAHQSPAGGDGSPASTGEPLAGADTRWLQAWSGPHGALCQDQPESVPFQWRLLQRGTLYSLSQPWDCFSAHHTWLMMQPVCLLYCLSFNRL